jgi:hypothetical protein
MPGPAPGPPIEKGGPGGRIFNRVIAHRKYNVNKLIMITNKLTLKVIGYKERG